MCASAIIGVRDKFKKGKKNQMKNWDSMPSHDRQNILAVPFYPEEWGLTVAVIAIEMGMWKRLSMAKIPTVGLVLSVFFEALAYCGNRLFHIYNGGHPTYPMDRYLLK